MLSHTPTCTHYRTRATPSLSLSHSHTRSLFLSPSLFSLPPKFAVLTLALLASASAFSPGVPAFSRSAQVSRLQAEDKDGAGAGGMFDTRDPDAKDDKDPRKSISAAPSFEEYLKQKALDDAAGK